MRSDMSRLIIEDGRRGDGGPKTCYKYSRPGEDFENYRSRESMSRHRKQDGNSSGDRLAPLKRYLEAQVGRPWNKVLSEICAVNDKRTIRGYHLLTHLDQYVRYPGTRQHSQPIGYQDFVVGPDGILRKDDWRKRRRWYGRKEKKEPVTEIKLENGWKYKKIDGLWFKIHISAIETRIPGKFVVRTYGIGKKYEWTSSHYVEGKTEIEYVQDRKMQCNKKEIKQIREKIDAGRR